MGQCVIFPKLQIVTVAELLDGRTIARPSNIGHGGGNRKMDLRTCGRKRRSRTATNARRELEPIVENHNKQATFNQPVTAMATHPMLKQFEDLSAADFAAWPVWIPCRPGDSGQPWYPQTDDHSYRPWMDALPVEETVAIKEKFFLEYSSEIAPIEPVVALAREWHGRKPLARHPPK